MERRWRGKLQGEEGNILNQFEKRSKKPLYNNDSSALLALKKLKTVAMRAGEWCFS